jgi:hypothetical protein
MHERGEYQGSQTAGDEYQAPMPGSGQHAQKAGNGSPERHATVDERDICVAASRAAGFAHQREEGREHTAESCSCKQACP